MIRAERMRVWLTLALLFHATTAVAGPPKDKNHSDVQGRYFAKKTYVPVPLHQFATLRNELPAPIYEAQPLWVELYWKAWELASRNFYEPPPGSGFVSAFIDAAFNENIFLWDSCFMTMFCNYGHPLVPGISTLDNFYAKQHADGEICREIVRARGADFGPWTNVEGRSLFSRWGWPEYMDNAFRERNEPMRYRGRPKPQPAPRLTLDALNHPIMAWAELESFRVTGDRARLVMVWEPLVRFYGALQKYLLQGNGLYATDWASMDNSPRNHYLEGGGTGIDISSEMALFARQLAEIAEILGNHEAADQYAREAVALAQIINRQMWDSGRKFYFDLSLQGVRTPVKTVAAYWTLLARVASPAQADALLKELDDHPTFGRMNPVPTLSADAEGYDPAGGYWRGSVWAPTETMVIRGVENYGYRERARALALHHLDLVAKVFQKTGTIWENYAPDGIAPGKPAARDFVGWSGIAPILFLLEYAIGLKPDAARNRLVWDLQPEGRTGCDRYRFNGHVTSLVAQPVAGQRGALELSVASDGDFSLEVHCRGKQETFAVEKGAQKFAMEFQ